MEPKSIEEVPSWVIMNALKCPVDAQISIVAKLLQHLDSEQRNQALSMSGVVSSGDLIERSMLIEQFKKSKAYYEGIGRFDYSAGFEKAIYLIASLGKKMEF
jgi:hypothetical protein